MNAASHPLPPLLAFGLCAMPLAVMAMDSGHVAPTASPLPSWSLPATEGLLTLRSPSWPMAKVVGGRFQMGSSPEEVVAALALCQREPMGHQCDESMFSDELPRRTVRLSPFWIDRHEVTWADYSRCVAAGRCASPRVTAGAKRFVRPDFPVSFVSHRDARGYCAFRGARLPTEAEWERAARGAEGRRFPWGNLYNDRVANHGKLAWSPTAAIDGHAELAAVGSYPSGATRSGIFDLAGNVAEWVSDRYLPGYLEHDVIDPQGPAAPPAGAERVVRGGGFHDAAVWMRAAARRNASPGERRPDIGLRCARSVTPATP